MRSLIKDLPTANDENCGENAFYSIFNLHKIFEDFIGVETRKKLNCVSCY